MRQTVSRGFLSIFLLALLAVAAATGAFSQTDYKVISVTDGGTISGTVKWAGPIPHTIDFPIT